MFLPQLQRHSGFIRNVATLMTGKTAAFAIAFLLTPVIARLFEPTHFGIAAFFISITVILGSVGSLRYEQAIVLPEDHRQGVLLVWLSTGLLAALCLLLISGITLLWVFGIPVPFTGRLGSWVWAFPLSVLLFGIVNVTESWLTRTGKFKTIAVSDVGQTLLNTGSRLAAGAALGSSVWALIGGFLLGLAGKIVMMARCLLGAGGGSHRDDKVLRSLPETAREYRDFPRYDTPSEFIRSFSDSLPVIMLAYLFSPAVVGFYAMADRVVRMPVNIGSRAVRRAYLQKTAELKNRKQSLRDAYIKTTITLILLGILPFGILWAEGERILTVFLGDRWVEAGRYVEILAPWLFVMWITTPSSALLVVLRRQASWFRFQIGMTLLRIAVFVIAYIISASPELTLTAYVAVSIITNAVVILYTYALVGRDSAEQEAT